MWTRYEDEVDVCIVGGGPSGLATAIRLRQMADEAGLDEDFRICVIEKVNLLQSTEKENYSRL